MSISAVSLRLEPGSSRTLTTTLVIAHVTAAVAILSSAWPLWVQSLCLVAVLSGALSGIRHSFQETRVNALSMMKDGSWRLTLCNGKELRAELGGDSLANPWLCLLVFRGLAGCRRVLLVRDSLDSRSFRRLRVALRVHPLTGRKSSASSRG